MTFLVESLKANYADVYVVSATPNIDLFKLIAAADCSKINQLIILTITAISLDTPH